MSQIFTCDICKETPCQTRSFCKLCRADERRNPGNRPLSERKPAPLFVESTLQASAWLKIFHPERLPRWWALHPGLKEFLSRTESTAGGKDAGAADHIAHQGVRS